MMVLERFLDKNPHQMDTMVAWLQTDTLFQRGLRPTDADFENALKDHVEEVRSVLDLKKRIVALEEQVAGLEEQVFQDAPETVPEDSQAGIIEELEAEIGTLKETVEWLNNQNSALAVRAEELRQQLKAKTAVDSDETHDTIEELRAQVKDLEKELGESKQQAKTEAAKVANADAVTASLRGEVQNLEAALKGQLHETTKANGASAGVIAALQAEVNELEEKLAEQKEKYSTTVGALKAEKAELNDQLEEMGAAFKSQFQEAAKAVGVEAVATALRVDVQNLKKELAEWKERYAKRVGALNADNSGLQAQLAPMKAELKSQLEETEAAKDAKASVTASLKAEVEELEKELEKMTKAKDVDAKVTEGLEA